MYKLEHVSQLIRWCDFLNELATKRMNINKEVVEAENRLL